MVLIRGVPHIVGSMTESGRMRYTPKAGGEDLLLTPGSIKRMEDQSLITAYSALDVLTHRQVEALGTDWGAFTEHEQQSALQKQPYVKKLDDLDAYQRLEHKRVLEVINAVFPLADYPDAPRPTIRTVREWDARWIASGRDVRALVDDHSKKGNRDGTQARWILDVVDEHIDLYMLTQPALKAEPVWRLIEAEVRIKRSENPSLPLDAKIVEHNAKHNDDRVIGRNLLRRRLKERGLYEQLVGPEGPREARRQSQSVGTGPTGLWPLHEAEVDHTMLDVLIVNEHGQIIGRPFLTVIIDRYSRMILGFAVEMIPPSWTTVMTAIQMAVQPKGPYLERLGIEFEFSWPGYGVWDFLFMDRGPEFRSASMTAAGQMLGFKLMDLPRASGQLKGKVERWIGVNNQRVIHNMVGTTDKERRKGYKPEKHARLTLEGVRNAVALFIVDHHNSSTHSQTGEWPSRRYEKAMEDAEIRKFAPDPQLLIPATAVAFNCQLNARGIAYETLRYESDDFRQMWRDAGGSTMVLGRISPLDPRTAMLLDPMSKKWVVGHLVGDHADTDLTLRQLLEQKKAEAPPPDTPEENLKRARSQKRLQALLDGGQQRVKLTRQQIRNAHESQKRTEHLQQQQYDPDMSSAPLESHDYAVEVELNPYDSSGPYAKPPIVGSDGSVRSRPKSRGGSQPEPPSEEHQLIAPAEAPSPAVVVAPSQLRIRD